MIQLPAGEVVLLCSGEAVIGGAGQAGSWDQTLLKFRLDRRVGAVEGKGAPEKIWVASLGRGPDPLGK